MTVKVRQNPHRKKHRLDLAQWRPEFKEILSFRGREASYTLEAGTTANLDYYLGERWDLVADEQLIVSKLVFRMRPFCSASEIYKLCCFIDMFSFAPNPEISNNRGDAREDIIQQYRTHDDDGDDDGAYEIVL